MSFSKPAKSGVFSRQAGKPLKRVEADKKPDLRPDSGFWPQIWLSQNKRQARFPDFVGW